MQTWPHKYRNQVCPFCYSKEIVAIAVTRMNGEYEQEVGNVTRTGYLCDNCKRYHINKHYKYIYDRAEIKRDINRLQKFLETGK